MQDCGQRVQPLRSHARAPSGRPGTGASDVSGLTVSSSARSRSRFCFLRAEAPPPRSGIPRDSNQRSAAGAARPGDRHAGDPDSARRPARQARI
jgi:hypothetical protein